MQLDIPTLAKTVELKQYKQADQLICDAIELFVLDKNAFKIEKELSEKQQTDYEVQMELYFNQLANLITILFSSKGYKPTKPMITAFLVNKPVVDSIFAASAWKNTDSLIEHLELIKPDRFGRTKFTKLNFTLLMMLITVGSKFRLPWPEMFKSSPELALTSYIGSLSLKVPALSYEKDQSYNYHLEIANQLPLLDLPDVTDINKLSHNIFTCSNSSSKYKYNFKKWVISLIQHNLKRWVPEDIKEYSNNLPSLDHNVKKLKIAVVLEVFKSSHAMYRCYKKHLDELSISYELVVFVHEETYDEIAVSSFERVITLGNKNCLADNLQRLTNEQPDIIFYPSIGMNPLIILMSQIRLAPIQVMSPGHPTTSLSPVIDYCLLPVSKQYAENLQQHFTEKLITLSADNQVITAHNKMASLTKIFVDKHSGFLEDSGEITIGINGIMTKVTYSVIDIIKKIQKKSSKKISLIFFSSSPKNSLGYLSTKKELSRAFNNFKLYSHCDYISYLKIISQCHLLLPTLPFGGSNSNVDAMIMNKPKLFIKGNEELYTRSDYYEWEMLGHVDELSCVDHDDLVEKAVSIVDNTDERKRLYDLLVEKKCGERVFCENEAEVPAIVELMKSAVDDHISQHEIDNQITSEVSETCVTS